MKRVLLILLLCAASGTATAQEERIVFPVPGSEDVARPYGFYGAAYLDEEGVQHLGVDISAQEGTVVISPVDGTIQLNSTAGDPFMAYLLIRSSGTGFDHVLAHIRSDLVRGASISAGDPVGKIVKAGTGPHLHYGVNMESVPLAMDVPAGWGFGRSPSSSTPNDALTRGWIDPEPFLAAARPLNGAQNGTASGFSKWMPGSDWTAGLVGPDAGYQPCGDQKSDDACLRRLGFGQEAIAFSFMMDQDYSGSTVGTSFMELGPVDLAVAQYTGANVYELPLLVNGPVKFYAVGSAIDLHSTVTDRTSQRMLKKFPNSTIKSMSIRSHRVLADGTQRFVLMEGIVDGCQACDWLGSAVSFVETRTSPDNLVGVTVQPIGLLLGPPEDTVDEMREDLFFSRPETLQVWLNSLGYDAGPMDGQPGRKTDDALREFQGDYCLAPTGILNDVSARALLDADGFDRPCARSSTVPNDSSSPLALAPRAMTEALDVPFSTVCTTQHDSECYAVFEVRGLDPNGDGFLAVRTGPGTNFLMKDQIYNGEKVTVFFDERQGPWYPIIYQGDRKGWAHRKWLYQISG